MLTDNFQGYNSCWWKGKVVALGSILPHFRILGFDKRRQRSISITFWPKSELWSFPLKGGKGHRVPKGGCMGPGGGCWRREMRRRQDVRRKDRGRPETGSLWKSQPGRVLSLAAEAMPPVLPLLCSGRPTWPFSSSAVWRAGKA